MRESLKISRALNVRRVTLVTRASTSEPCGDVGPACTLTATPDRRTIENELDITILTRPPGRVTGGGEPTPRAAHQGRRRHRPQDVGRFRSRCVRHSAPPA